MRGDVVRSQQRGVRAGGGGGGGGGGEGAADDLFDGGVVDVDAGAEDCHCLLSVSMSCITLWLVAGLRLLAEVFFLLSSCGADFFRCFDS